MVTLVFFWCSTASAESTLPPCQGEDSMQWTNCYGSYTNRDITDYVLKKFPSMNKLYPNSSYKENYEGEFGSKPGLKHGHGIRNLYLNDEIYSNYEGKYFNDQRKGYGVYTNIMRNWEYEGDYENDLRHGQGTTTYASGNKFVGEYKDSKRNGKGTITFANGDKFVGEYKDGKQNGKGTYTWADGDKEVALYKDGEVVKIISSTIKKESSSSSSSSSTFSSSTLSGYEHCKSVWRKLINIRNRYSKNSYNYNRLDALVQTAFDLWTTYKGTNAKDTGNCDQLLSLGNN